MPKNFSKFIDLLSYFKSLDWQEPHEIASKIAASSYQDDFVFLYSGLSDSVKSSKSIIALFPFERLICEDLNQVGDKIDQRPYFGYISYEAVHDFEKINQTKPSFINLPKIHLVNFAIILEFNHEQQSLRVNYSDKKYLRNFTDLISENNSKPTSIKAKTINSNFTNQEYLSEIDKIRQEIAKGEFYQVNLTRKYFGQLSSAPDLCNAFNIFTELSKSSPANYSSFLSLGNNFIISSSPELFLLRNQQDITSIPIKGTSPRSKDQHQDNLNKQSLRESKKEQAENLMIVDLVRNDLSKICQPKSVKVDELFKISSYSKIHHMSSRISGKLNLKTPNLKTLKALFPPGSMTGAPKIAAMNHIAKTEKLNRGIYSGAIGYFGPDQINLSVVIRTLVISNDKFEFQSGGAITFDSSSEDELNEILIKAKAIGEVLNIFNLGL